jgi:hypothetical protein
VTGLKSIHGATLVFFAALIAVGIALISYKFFGGSGGSVNEVGRIESVSGEVSRRLPGNVQFESVVSPQPLLNQELLQSQRASEAVVVLKTGTKIRMGEGSRFVVETDMSRADSLIGTVIEGTVSVVEPGDANRFRLFQQGREVPLSATGGTISSSANDDRFEDQPIDVAGGLVITATTPDETAPTPAPSESVAPPRPGSSADVLTNEDILRNLRAQTGFFQRCYLTFIHRSQSQSPQNEAATGTVVVSFRIEPSGRIPEATIARSDFSDQILHRCITEVIERTRFKAFSSKPIPVLEFPITLQ